MEFSSVSSVNCSGIVRVLLYGKTGSGKTTMINHLSNGNYETSDRAVGVTFAISESERVVENNSVYSFFDTIGLNETSDGTVDNFSAFLKLKDFLKHSMQGFNLFVFVFEKGRISEADKQNVELFTKILGDNKVPSVMVISKADDGLQSMDDLVNNKWYKENMQDLEKAFGKTTFQNVQEVAFVKKTYSMSQQVADFTNSTSKKLLFDLFEKHATKEPVIIVTKESFVTVLNKIVNWLFTRTKQFGASIFNTVANIFNFQPINYVDEREERLVSVIKKLMGAFPSAKEEEIRKLAEEILG